MSDVLLWCASERRRRKKNKMITLMFIHTLSVYLSLSICLSIVRVSVLSIYVSVLLYDFSFCIMFEYFFILQFALYFLLLSIYLYLCLSWNYSYVSFWSTCLRLSKLSDTRGQKTPERTENVTLLSVAFCNGKV